MSASSESPPASVEAKSGGTSATLTAAPASSQALKFSMKLFGTPSTAGLPTATDGPPVAAIPAISPSNNANSSSGPPASKLTFSFKLAGASTSATTSTTVTSTPTLVTTDALVTTNDKKDKKDKKEKKEKKDKKESKLSSSLISSTGGPIPTSTPAPTFSFSLPMQPSTLHTSTTIPTATTGNPPAPAHRYSAIQFEYEEEEEEEEEDVLVFSSASVISSSSSASSFSTASNTSQSVLPTVVGANENMNSTSISSSPSRTLDETKAVNILLEPSLQSLPQTTNSEVKNVPSNGSEMVKSVHENTQTASTALSDSNTDLPQTDLPQTDVGTETVSGTPVVRASRRRIIYGDSDEEEEENEEEILQNSLSTSSSNTGDKLDEQNESSVPRGHVSRSVKRRRIGLDSDDELEEESGTVAVSVSDISSSSPLLTGKTKSVISGGDESDDDFDFTKAVLDPVLIRATAEGREIARHVLRGEPIPLGWIMCDDQSCAKWRKLPALLGEAELEALQQFPWFCFMHPSSRWASCSVPEEQFETDV